MSPLAGKSGVARSDVETVSLTFRMTVAGAGQPSPLITHFAGTGAGGAALPRPSAQLIGEQATAAAVAADGIVYIGDTHAILEVRHGIIKEIGIATKRLTGTPAQQLQLLSSF
jgi:hypothetical protein